MQKILSVSVACYNLKEMIEDNIKSFCESSVRDKIELLIIDDGSTDNTVEFVRKWVKEYPNTVKLIAKENGGPGSTVNCGIKNATGKYFRMLDGDDMAMTENLEGFIRMLENTDADMVISNFCLMNNETKEIYDKTNFKLEEGVVKSFDEVYKEVPTAMHAITYKTSILQDNDITIDDCFYTDTQYVLYPIPYVKTVIFYKGIIYIYRIGNENQSVSVRSKIKNRSMHEFVTFNNIKFYETNKEKLSRAQRNYMCRRIRVIGINQASIFFYLPISKESKELLRAYINRVKSESKDAYHEILKSKKVKLVVMSNYLFYSPIAKYIHKKEKIDN